MTPKMFQGAADIYRFVAGTSLGKDTPENRDKNRDGKDVVPSPADRDAQKSAESVIGVHDAAVARVQRRDRHRKPVEHLRDLFDGGWRTGDDEATAWRSDRATSLDLGNLGTRSGA